MRWVGFADISIYGDGDFKEYQLLTTLGHYVHPGPRNFIVLETDDLEDETSK